MEHTPWKAASSAIVYTDTGPFLEDATGTTIGRIFSGDDFSVAEDVAHAVNNHAKLLEALEELTPLAQQFFQDYAPDATIDFTCGHHIRLARAAIKAAKGD